MKVWYPRKICSFIQWQIISGNSCLVHKNLFIRLKELNFQNTRVKVTEKM